MTRRIEPDDEVHRFLSVFLGPAPYTLWWHARYLSYIVWAVIFGGIITIEAILPFLPIHLPPTYELAASIAATYAVMQGVDHDRPVRAAIANVTNLTRLPTRDKDTATIRRPRLPSTVKTTKAPL